MKVATSCVLSAWLLAVPAAAQGGELFENVVDVLLDDYYDRGYREDVLPELAELYRDRARATGTLEAERAVVDAFLSEIPVSHLALYSQATSDSLMNGLRGTREPSLGFQLMRRGDDYFVHTVWEGGPAERAGLRRGDRVTHLNDIEVARSPRLDWRSDDAHLADIPLHAVLCDGVGDDVTVQFERAPGEGDETEIVAEAYSAFDASRASVQVIEFAGQRFGYVHLHYMFVRGTGRLMREAFDAFEDCDGMVLDLRGRGGSASAVNEVTRALARSWDRPCAVLIDEDTRSAKEMLADRIAKRDLGVLVGERTAGAVIPATFRKVGSGAVLMFPSMTLGSDLEGVGVPPDVAVEAAGPYAGGADPILVAALGVLLEAD